jgi:outer membrane protein assembly factor BamB
VVIELSTDWDQGEPVKPWRPRRRPRLVAGLVVCLLLVSVLAGSTGRASAWRLVASVPGRLGSYCVLSDDQLFVMTPEIPSHSTELAAYRLGDGHRLWHTTLPAGLAVLPIPGPAHVVLAELFNDGVDDPQRLRYAGLDAATGRILWQLTDVSLVGGVGYEDPGLLVSVAAAGGASELHMVDLRSGAVLWSRAIAPQSLARSLGGGRALVASPDGVAQVLGVDGRVVTSGHLTFPAPAAPDAAPEAGPGFFPIDGQVTVTDPRNDHTVITSYDLATLAQRWRIDVADVIRSLNGCGPVLCVNGNRGVMAIDPVTGERLWTSTTWFSAYPMGEWLQASGPPERSGRNVLLDPVSGRPVLDLADWSMMSPGIPGAPATVLNGRTSGAGVWIGSVRGSEPRIWPAAFLPGAIANRCAVDETGSRYVACATLDGPVRLWTSG